MRYAIIDGSKVINVIEADQTFIDEHQLNAVSVKDKNCGIGFTYIDDEFFAPVTQIDETNDV